MNYWLSKDGQVLPTPVSKEDVQARVDAGESVSLMPVEGDQVWKSTEDLGFKLTVKDRFSGISPVVFESTPEGEKHFAYVYGKTAMIRSERTSLLVDLLNGKKK
jgi:hypothetical protein